MRILLIEDDRKAAKLLAKGLREEGFVVDVAPTGEEGEEQAVVNEYDVGITTPADVECLARAHRDDASLDTGVALECRQ